MFNMNWFRILPYSKNEVENSFSKQEPQICCDVDATMEFITRLLYPVWTFARSTIESILGKRGRDEIVDNNDDIVDLSPTISDIFFFEFLFQIEKESCFKCKVINLMKHPKIHF